MSNIKPLKQIKLEIDILSLDIDNLEDEEEKLMAVDHLEQTSLRMLNARAPTVKMEAAEPSPASPVNMKEVNDEILNNPEPRLYNGLVPTCTQCGNCFPSLGLLDSHMKIVHPDVPTSNYQPGPSEDLNFICSQRPKGRRG